MKFTILIYVQVILACIIYFFPNLAQSQQFELVKNTPIGAVADGSRSAAFVDVNNDGFLDIFISNGPKGGQNNSLYLNNGKGNFTKVTKDPLVQDGAPSDGATWGDIDNDGDLDVYIVNWYGKPNLFYINDGQGHFTQITQGDIIQKGFSETASWGDFDNDGDLDLYVTNSSPNRSGQQNFFIQNNGDGRFSLNTQNVITQTTKDARSINWIDYNNDGRLDIFITHEDGSGNQLFKNTKTGFQPVKNNFQTKPTASMGSSWADYDNDGDLDLLVANFRSKALVFNNQGDGTFKEVEVGLARNGLSFGATWGDIDNDGDLDLFVANATFSKNKVINFLYINDGQGRFTRDTTSVIATYQGNTFGAAFGDYDNDGDLDLVTANTFQSAEANTLYRNLGNKNHWVNISLKGTISNASAIGAKLRVKAVIGGKSVWQMREISSQSGYNCQNSLRAHFGLNKATKIDSLIIEWPSGGREVKIDLKVNQFYTFQEAIPYDFVRANFTIKVDRHLQATTKTTIQFTNLSLSHPKAKVRYNWDFDNDGVIDSRKKNPTHTYTKPGAYTIRLIVSNGTQKDTIIRKKYVQIKKPGDISNLGD